MTAITKQPQPLQGKRILVTALDLEQREHRGIAVYSKALIRHLHRMGAEVWLLTQFRPVTSDLHSLPKETQRIIYSARTLNELAHGKKFRSLKLPEIFPKTSKFNVNDLLMQALTQALMQTQKLIRWIFGKTSFRLKELKSFRLSELNDNPNLRISRLDYLQDVEGIVSLDNVYEASQFAAYRKHRKPVTIDLEGFDVFITCCPLNLQPRNTSMFVQTVHDLIALEYEPHNENTRQFTHRLQACLPAQRIHVSSSTCRKFHNHINVDEVEGPLGGEDTVVQPPSLYLPSLQRNAGDQANDLTPSCYLLHDQRRQRNSKPPALQPFRYLLFNSSVEARKNLLFLVKAFAQSGLGREGIRLCVTGKLKKDAYSKAVREVVTHEPAILLSGYVDEATKLDLYLNALALLSPSLVEGFGIPVLDAACLGMPALVSSCDAHREIHDLFDFSDYVLPISVLETRDWAAAMQATTTLHQHLADEPDTERMKRLRRYCHMSQKIEDRFEEQIAQLLLG